MESKLITKPQNRTMAKIRQLGIIIFLMIIISYSNGQTTSTLEHVIPEFKISFPETTFNVEKTERRNPNLGNILITNWILQGKDKNGPFVYFVTHNKYPTPLKEAEKTDPKTLEVAFQAILTSSATKLGGTDFEFTNIEYNGFKGMESTCKVFNGDGIIKSRIYKIDNDLFMISAGGRKIDIKSVDDFLNSFRLKKFK